MKPKTFLSAVLLLLLPAFYGCLNPSHPDFGSVQRFEEYRLAYSSLRVYYFFQDELPADPFVYNSPEELFNVLDDPWTHYISPEIAGQVMAIFDPEYSIGFGIFLQSHFNTFYVRNVIDNSPAQGRLIKGDTLLKVNHASVVGISHDALFDLLDVDEGVSVTFTVLRDSNTVDVTLSAGRFVAPTVFADTLDDSVAYIALLEFLDTTSVKAKSTADEMYGALSETQDFPVRILDLRMNPGGLVDQCLSICNEFLNNGATIIKARQREYDESLGRGVFSDTVYHAKGGGIAIDRPFVVLVDSNTASAAELLTSALRENRTGTDHVYILGCNTFGKARGQYLIPTLDAGILIITAMTFTTAHDSDYNAIGIAPDTVLGKDVDWLEYAYTYAAQKAGSLPKSLAGRTIGRIRDVALNRKLAGLPRREKLEMRPIPQ